MITNESSREVECPRCGAAVGEVCRKTATDWAGPASAGDPYPAGHTARIELRHPSRPRIENVELP